MTVNVDDKIARLDADRRRQVEVRAAELIAEEMTLRELRKAQRLTQARARPSSASLRTASRGWSSGATSCFPPGARRSRRWAAACRSSPVSPTGRRSRS